jgi:glycosyltransferase involved in cell wall biosynthesis
VAFHEVVRRRVAALVPAAAPRTHVIAQAVRCPGEAIDLRGRLGFGGDEFVFLQAAGIRPVKNIPSVIPALSALHTRHPRVRYVLAGPVLEPAEGARVTELLRPLPWAACIGPLPHAELHAGLGSADVAINSSLSEGGMSNAVLEAMGQGVVVLASNIDGNRSVIVDGEDGFLYASEAEFVLKAERLLADAALRARVGQRARQKIRELFSPAAEISAHLGLYRGLLGLGEEG